MSDPTRPEASAAEPTLDPELSRALRQAPGAPPELEALFASLEQEVQRERGLPAFLRSRSTVVRNALLASVAGAVVLLAYLAFARPDLSAYPLGRMATVLAIAGLGAFASLRLALRPVYQAPAPSWLLPLIASLSLCGLAAVYMMPALPALDAAHVPEPGLDAALHLAAPCLGIGLLITLGLVGLWWLLDRGGARRGLAAAAAAGLTANLALQLHCPITAPGHLLLGHLGVALVILGVALAARK